MFKLISDQIPQPEWSKACPRYRVLDLLDRFLDGTFYDHLPYAFYEEEDNQGRYIEITKRRPSVRSRLAKQIARQTARKLFAGRHVPKITHDDEDVKEGIQVILKSSKFWAHMLQAAIFGSVGSVAVTFCLVKPAGATDAPPNVIMEVFRSKQCWPTFDQAGELECLRIAYVCYGSELAQFGIKVDDPNLKYWYVRDITRTQDIVYRPIEEKDWNPVDAGTDKVQALVAMDDRTVSHNFGFVPGHWFVNLSGGTAPDGACTWDPAIPKVIELDYTLSQMGRGGRYCGAPQLFIAGDLAEEVEVEDSATGGGMRAPVRSTAVVLRGMAAHKDQTGGEMMGETKAQLLEMTGQGLKAVLDYCNNLKKEAKEEISGARKDPETMKGPLSGRAMELIDEEFHDLIQELRTAYGEDGALPLLRKLLRAFAKFGGMTALFGDDVVGKVGFAWPRLFQPTPQDLVQIVPALVAAVVPPQPKAAATNAGEGAGPPATDANDYLEGRKTFLLTAQEARNVLLSILDIPEPSEVVTGEPTDETGHSPNPAPPDETRDITQPANPGGSRGEVTVDA